MNKQNIIRKVTEQNVRALQYLHRCKTGNLTEEDLQYQKEQEERTKNSIKNGFFCPYLNEGFQPNYCTNTSCLYKDICKSYNRKPEGLAGKVYPSK